MTDAEKAMDGAPQGEIFDVTVAYDENITPSNNPDEEIIPNPIPSGASLIPFRVTGVGVSRSSYKE